MATVIFPPVEGIWSVGAPGSTREQRREFAFGRQKMLEFLAEEIFSDKTRCDEVENALRELTWDDNQKKWLPDEGPENSFSN